MWKKEFLMATVAGIALLGAGCNNVAHFDYQEVPVAMVEFPAVGEAGKTVAVLPFLDQRSVKYLDPMQQNRATARPAGDRGSLYLGFIPLLPFGIVTSEEPEKRAEFVSLGYYHFNPAQDLAAAAEASLKKSGLFSNVQRANSREQATADLVWQGTVSNTFYSGSMMSYCITYFFVTPLWVLGAPSGVSNNELWVDFTLSERVSGRKLWSFRFRGSDSTVHWIYARVGEDCSKYPVLMRKAMNGAIYSLREKSAAWSGDSVR